MADSSATPRVINAEPNAASETVRLQYHPPTDTDSGAALCNVLLCNPLPLAGDSSRYFMDALRDALLEARCAVASYESQSEGAILDDYHSYTAPEALDEARSALKQLLHTGIAADTVVIIGYGVGAIIAAALLDDISDALGLCLINPASPTSVTGSLAKRSEKEADSSEAAVPRAFIKTVSEINALDALGRRRCPMLVLNGAADDIVDMTDARTFVDAAHDGRAVSRLLIAHGNHAFTDPHARQAALEQVTVFIESLAAQS